MIRFSKSCALTLAALTLLATAAAAPAAAEERPFKAAGIGSVNYGGWLEGTGTATHLGDSALFAFFNPDYFGSGGFFWPSSLGQLTAANGDFLLFDFGPDIYPINPSGIVVVPLTFVAGTGRFEHAAGSATAMFMFDWETGNFFYLIDGSINY